MAVRMTHPLHGVTHAVGAEVKWNEAHGWKVEPKPIAPEMVLTGESTEKPVTGKTITLHKAKGN